MSSSNVRWCCTTASAESADTASGAQAVPSQHVHMLSIEKKNRLSESETNRGTKGNCELIQVFLACVT